MLALVSLTLFCFHFYAFAKEPAWNGHAPPGSNTPSKFTPYYVPEGTAAYDSTSSAVVRSGDWYVARSSEYINGSTLATTSRNASLVFAFKGTGIEIYGGVGKRYGSFDIYLDREYVGARPVRDSKDRQQQLIFFSYDLASSPHEISLVNKGSNSGSLLDIDAFVVTDRGTPSVNSEASLASMSSSKQVQSTADSKDSHVQGLQGDPDPTPADHWTLVPAGIDRRRGDAIGDHLLVSRPDH